MAEISYEISKDLKRIDVQGQPHGWRMSGQLIFTGLSDPERRLLGFPEADKQKYAELETVHFMPFSEAIPIDCDREAVSILRAEKRMKGFMDRLNTLNTVTEAMVASGNIKDKYTVMKDLEKEIENG